ncbi:MAG: FAD:protein FMN transferase [Actinobacteria bacterium]|nr:FAD:protein FMN transferase [Actinomycetota bacterium]
MSTVPPPATATSRGVYHPLLGTNVEIRVAATGSDAQARAEAGERAALEEMVRLQSVFSVFDPGSELSRWRAGGDHEPSAELVEVLEAAQHWWTVSGGGFHPATARLRQRWLRAEAEQRLPSDDELAGLARDLRTLPFEVADGVATRLGDCSGLDLNAIAKGYIVDRGVAVAAGGDGVVDVLVNAGGDLRHVGADPVRVGVEDPRSVGGAPIRVVELGEAAMATSGPVHRGFRIGEQWFGHVLDPRTGRPVAERPSTTVRALDAMTADALATVVGVLDWTEAVRVLRSVPGAAAITIDPAGEVRTCGSW